jgi:hypothetical protein
VIAPPQPNASRRDNFCSLGWHKIRTPRRSCVRLLCNLAEDEYQGEAACAPQRDP